LAREVFEKVLFLKNGLFEFILFVFKEK
jgi:hypothetical protein